MRFTKKPVTITAWQYLGNPKERPDWVYTSSNHYVLDNTLRIHTLEGEMTASVGDWIIQGVSNEVYPCKPDIFEKTYSVAVEDGRPHCADTAIHHAVTALDENPSVGADEFVEAMRAWNEGAWDEFRSIVDVAA